MKLIGRWSIRRKLNVVLTLCGMVFIAIAAPIINNLGVERYEKEAQVQQQRLVGVLSSSAAIATYVSNEEIAQEVLQGLLEDDEILAAQIVGKGDFVKLLKRDNQSQITLNDDEKRYYSLYSPVDQYEGIGVINVWPNTKLISQRAARNAANYIFMLVLLTLILGIASMFATNLLVASPLRHLADQVSATTPGEKGFINVSGIHKQDEIGMVTYSVNGFLSVTRVAIQAERELRLQIERMNQHFSNVFASSHVGIMVTDEEGRLLHHNPVLLDSIIKLNASHMETLPQQDIFSLAFSDHDAVTNLIERARSTEETAEADLLLTLAWRTPCWVHCILTVSRDQENDKEIIECVLHDVTRRVQEAEAIKQLAQQDALTGLYNRRGCELYFKRWQQDPNETDHLVVMLLDLDSFKPINDAHGHGAGDFVLQTIAARLQAEVRANMDLIGRIGGDEFVVFLKMKNDQRNLVEQVARKILISISEKILLNSSQSVSVGVSIGITMASGFETLEDAMKIADEAMYQVKLKGKNDFIFAN